MPKRALVNSNRKPKTENRNPKPEIRKPKRARNEYQVKSTVEVFDWEKRDYYVEHASIVPDPLARSAFKPRPET